MLRGEAATQGRAPEWVLRDGEAVLEGLLPEGKWACQFS